MLPWQQDVMSRSLDSLGNLLAPSYEDSMVLDGGGVTIAPEWWDDIFNLHALVPAVESLADREEPSSSTPLLIWSKEPGLAPVSSSLIEGPGKGDNTPLVSGESIPL